MTARGAVAVKVACGAVLALAIAAVFRLWHWDSVPGLYVDEVHTARNALAWRLDPERSLFGSRPLIGEDWVRTANLYLAYFSAVMRAFGDGLLGVRMASVLPSLLCVPLVLWLGIRMAGWRAGVLAALFFACSHWAARIGRWGWDEVMMTALQLLTLACLAERMRGGRRGWALAAGVALALCLHTYVASRLVAASIALWLVWELGRARPRREATWTWFLCLVPAVLLVAPYHWHLADTPGGINVRVGQIGLDLTQPSEWRVLAKSALYHLGMFHVRGSLYARDNLPGEPMLDAVTGAWLLVGLAVVGCQRDWRRRLMLTWFGVCILGGVFSKTGEGPPYAYRVANLAPWACLLAGIGLSRVLDLVPGPRFASPTLGALSLLAAIGLDAHVLVSWARMPDTFAAFGTLPTRIGRLLREERTRGTCSVFPAWWTPPSVRNRCAWPSINGDDFYEPITAVSALLLSAGVLRDAPAFARGTDAVLGGGGIRIPGNWAQLAPGTRCVVIYESPKSRDALAERFTITEQLHVIECDGIPVVSILRVTPR